MACPVAKDGVNSEELTGHLPLAGALSEIPCPTDPAVSIACTSGLCLFPLARLLCKGGYISLLCVSKVPLEEGWGNTWALLGLMLFIFSLGITALTCLSLSA